MADIRTETMTVNMGPQHPSTHGVLRLMLELDGEVVQSVIPTIGYLHTGIEKTAEQKKWQQVIPLVERMDYLGAQSNSLAYALSVEKLLGLEMPQRVKDIRVLLAELQRIASHLIWIGTHGLEIGAVSMLFYAVRERELLLNINELIAGFRFFPSYIRIGGLREDLPRGFHAQVQEFLDRFPTKIDEFEGLLTKNDIYKRRTEGVGYITREHAYAWGLVGPIARAGGSDYDVRKYLPVHRVRDLRVQGADGHRGRRLRALSGARGRDARESQDREAGARSHQPDRRLRLRRHPRRAAAEGQGLQRDGSADPALPDLLAGVHRAGRRRVCAGRGAARRARLLHRVGRHQPAVAGEDARAVVHGHPGAADGGTGRPDRRRRGRHRLHRRRHGRLRPVSFHPQMEYAPARFHRSERKLADEGQPFAYTPENQAKFDENVTHYPPEQRKSAILYALYLAQGQLGYLTGDAMRFVAQQIGCSTADVEDVVSYYTMFYTKAGRQARAQRVPDALVRAARRGARHRGTGHTLGIKPGETDRRRRVHADRGRVPGRCDRAPVVMVNDDWHERLAPEQVSKFIDDLKARGSAAFTGCHLKKE